MEEKKHILCKRKKKNKNKSRNHNILCIFIVNFLMPPLLTWFFSSLWFLIKTRMLILVEPGLSNGSISSSKVFNAASMLVVQICPA